MSQSPQNKQAFLTIWIGQLISQLGSGLTGFALTYWVFSITGSATNFAMMLLVRFLPSIFASPFAGLIVDRMDRRRVMLITTHGTCSAIAVLALLFWTELIQVWHLYPFLLITGTLEVFQRIAYQAAVTTLVPKDMFVRANGMKALVETAPFVAAPLLAGWLLVVLGCEGIMVLDLATFAVAIVTLLAVKIPQPSPSTADVTNSSPSYWARISFGTRYIAQSPGLFSLLLVQCFTFLLFGLSGIGSAMIMARSGNDEHVLALATSIGGIGGLFGGILLTYRKHSNKTISYALAALLLNGILGRCLFGIADSAIGWVAGLFLLSLLTTVSNSMTMAVWQGTTPPDIQGRVFAARSWFINIALPIGYLGAGFLSDQVFEPAMMPSGSLAGAFGWLAGTGPGAGMGLLTILCGFLGAIVALLAYFYRPLRNIEATDADANTTLPAQQKAL